MKWNKIFDMVEKKARWNNDNLAQRYMAFSYPTYLS
jgi:hypothetical protein